MRDVANRYKGLPPRTPEMLFNIVRKFYRGAVSHYDLIQQKKEETKQAYTIYRETGDPESVNRALTILFSEFHFYVTCWLQIDLALYRLAKMEETKRLSAVFERFGHQLKQHVAIRQQLDNTEQCTVAQWSHFGPGLSGIEKDQYWFDGVYFTVDEASLSSLHQLHQAVMNERGM